LLRRLEKYDRPTVAAINGAALGGGLELALACHHRIAVDDNKTEIGFPEVTLGLLPGAGGVTRSVRKLGIAAALVDWLLQGQRYKPAKAKEKGLIEDLVATREELLPAAHAWLVANKENESARVAPWDVKGYKIPGGTPSTPAFAANLPAFPANLRKQLKGADIPAPKQSWPRRLKVPRLILTPQAGSSPALHRTCNRPHLNEHDSGIFL